MEGKKIKILFNPHDNTSKRVVFRCREGRNAVGLWGCWGWLGICVAREGRRSEASKQPTNAPPPQEERTQTTHLRRTAGLVGVGSCSMLVYLAGMTNCIAAPDMTTGAVMVMGSALPVCPSVWLIRVLLGRRRRVGNRSGGQSSSAWRPCPHPHPYTYTHTPRSSLLLFTLRHDDGRGHGDRLGLIPLPAGGVGGLGKHPDVPTHVSE